MYPTHPSQATLDCSGWSSRLSCCLLPPPAPGHKHFPHQRSCNESLWVRSVAQRRRGLHEYLKWSRVHTVLHIILCLSPSPLPSGQNQSHLSAPANVDVFRSHNAITIWIDACKSRLCTGHASPDTPHPAPHCPQPMCMTRHVRVCDNMATLCGANSSVARVTNSHAAVNRKMLLTL